VKKKIQILHVDKPAEEELAFRNIILSAQLETSIDGILVVDANNKIILYNHRFIEMMGIPQELIERKKDEPVLRFVTDQIADPQEFLARIQYLYEHKRETSHEEINFRDGRTFDRYSSPMFGSGDHYYGRVWYLRDVTKYRRAEEALKKSETLFRSYFELPIAGIAITSPTKGWIEVNDHLCEMLGYKREELLQTTWSELTYPDDLDLDVDNFNRVIKGEIDRYSIDKRFVRKDGDIIWTSLFVNCVRPADGKVDYFVTTLFDISERKRAEEAIRESEERFRLVFDNVFDGISIYDEDPDPFKRKLIECNAQYAVMAGRTREELLRMGNIQALLITHEETANKTRLESLSRNIEFRGSFSWIRPDGKENLIEYIGMPIVWRGKSLSIGIDRDITMQRQAEEKLRKNEEKYRNIFENVQDVYYEISIDGTILEVSPSIEIVSNGQYKRDDLIGKSMFDFYGSPEERNALLSVLQEHGSVMDFEITLRNKDGSTIPCSISAKFWNDTQGNRSKIIGSMRDITERKRIENEIQDLNTVLEQRVNERTKELELKNTELARMNRLFVGRELRMAELKQIIKRLEEKHKS
jgi:PAS domain S-box-containing protein